MTQSWMDTVGPSVVASLSQQCSVKLTPRLVNFLERFADKVEGALRARNLGARNAARFAQELRSVNLVVREEITTLQHSSLFSHHDISDLYARRHVETCLPIVHLRIRELPELVVHVFRSYCTTRRGVTYGHRLIEYCGGRAVGPVARAINFLKERCREVEWQLSISELLSIWTETALAIPIEERVKCGQSRPQYIPDLMPEYHVPPPAANVMEPVPKLKGAKRKRLAMDDEANAVFHPEYMRRDGGRTGALSKGKRVDDRLDADGDEGSRKAGCVDSDVEIVEEQGGRESDRLDGYVSNGRMQEEEVVACGGGNPGVSDTLGENCMYEAEEILATGGGDRNGDDKQDREASDGSLSYEFNRNDYADGEEEIVATGGNI